MEYALPKDGVFVSSEFSADAVQTEGLSRITLQASVDGNPFADQCHIRTSRNYVTSVPFPSDVTLRLTSDSPFSYAYPGMQVRYSGKEKVADYLYEITYGNIDYGYAEKYFDPVYASGGCSAVRKGRFYGRNFDWIYDDSVQFIVHTPRSLGRRAVLGVAGLVPGITDKTVEMEDVFVDGVDMFKLLPFHLLDGINDAGVFCTHNLVPLDDKSSPTSEVKALGKETERIAVPMLPRFVLDYFRSADEAIHHLLEHTTMFFTDAMLSAGYQSHLMIGDSSKSFAVEFVGGKARVFPSDRLTNFNLTGVNFSSEGKIAYPPTAHGIDMYGFGLERWDIISDMLDKSSGRSGVRGVMDALTYSRGYGDPFWYSEAVRGTDDDGGVITVDTDPSKCSSAMDSMREAYRTRDRSAGGVWITTHSSVYDVSTGELFLVNQEDGVERRFAFLS